MRRYMKRPMRVDSKVPMSNIKPFFALFLILTLSCKSQKETVQKYPDSIGLTLVLSDGHSGEETKSFYVIKEAETLRKYFSKINRTRKPGLPVPDIDYTQYVVLLFFEGETTIETPSQKYIMEENTDQIVIGSEGSEQPKKYISTAIVTPFQIYTIPLTNKEIVFREKPL